MKHKTNVTTHSHTVITLVITTITLYSSRLLSSTPPVHGAPSIVFLDNLHPPLDNAFGSFWEKDEAGNHHIQILLVILMRYIPSTWAVNSPVAADGKDEGPPIVPALSTPRPVSAQLTNAQVSFGGGASP